MKRFKLMLPVAMILFLATLLAACTAAPSSPTTQPGDTPTTAPTTAPTTGVVIKTATASVKGQSESILTNDQGMTLYYFKPDTATTSACTSDCASTWPPLLNSGSGQPSSNPALSGKLTVVSDANGTQVQYNGHFLYTFSGDSKPGDTNGQGIGGKWFVATPTLS